MPKSKELNGLYLGFFFITWVEYSPSGISFNMF